MTTQRPGLSDQTADLIQRARAGDRSAYDERFTPGEGSFALELVRTRQE